MSFAIYVGSDHARAGHGWLAGYGDEPSGHWLELVPRTEHAADASITVGVTREAAMPGVLTEIPQASTTARQLRVSYTHYLGVPAPLTNGGLNEHGVAVRDVWSPSREELIPMTPRDQTGPNYSDLARIVLDRATTARAGVELIGDLIARYGYSTYGGNSHLIADADEAWVVIEYAGGQGLWVAERLGTDALRASRPGWIAEVPGDLDGGGRFLAAPHFIDFAREQGWYDPARDGTFDANRIYGDGLGRWEGVRWVEDELERRSRAGGIGLSDLAAILRAPHLTGDSAGYGQIVPLERDVEPELRTLWHAPIGALAAPFTPFVLGVSEIPPELREHRYLGDGEGATFVDFDVRERPQSRVPQGIEATRSAVAAAKRLLYLVCEHHDLLLPEVTPVWEALEADLDRQLQDQQMAARALIERGQPDVAERLLTRWCDASAIRGLDLVQTMAASIDVRMRLRFGVRNTPDWRGPEQIW